MDNQDEYNALRDAIIPIRSNIHDVEQNMQAGTEEYHHPQELLAMLTATKDLCEFILERGMDHVKIEQGQKLVQTAIATYKRYAPLATELERRVHDLDDTIFFLQWLLANPQINN